MTEQVAPTLTRNEARTQLILNIKTANAEKNLKRLVFKMDTLRDEQLAMSTAVADVRDELTSALDEYLELIGYEEPVEESDTKTEPSHDGEDTPASEQTVDVEFEEVKEDDEKEDIPSD